MLSPYARILAVPGARRFSLTGLVARIPISTVSLGIVLLVSARTGSYGLAGSVAAVYVLANAALAIVHGRLADRIGQARALAPAIVVFGAGGLALTAAVLLEGPAWTVYVAAAVTGASLPQVGSCVRARWAHALRGDDAQVQTAFALEAVVDEAVFITGPILVTLLATTVHPASGLGVAVVIGVVGTLALAAQRGTQPPPAPVVRTTAGGPRESGPRQNWRVVAPLTGAFVGLGALFGAAEVATVAFAEERGASAWAGVLLALYALGSLAAGVVVGLVHWKVAPTVRMRRGALVLTVAMAPLVVVEPVWLAGIALLVAGAAISPTLISATSLVERASPPQRVTEAMAVLHTGLAAGIAPGAALAGLGIDHWGAHAAYAVPVAAGVLTVVCAWLTPVAPRRPGQPERPHEKAAAV